MTKRYQLALVPCSKLKNPVGVTPASLYRSPLFGVTLKHAQLHCNQVLIMSAKYGLLKLTDRVAVYEAYLPKLDVCERAVLATELRAKFLEYGLRDINPNTVLSYLPKAYFDFFASIGVISEWAQSIHRPYKNLPLFALMETLHNEINVSRAAGPSGSGPELSGLPRIRITPDAYEP